MEEVIRALRERNEEVPVPLDTPEFEDLVEAEEQMLMPLTPEYREFLMNATDIVYGRYEPATVADPHSHSYLPDVAAQAWSLGVPREYIPICEYQGTYYCVAQDETIIHWQSGEIDDATWPCIWHWARSVWLEGDI